MLESRNLIINTHPPQNWTWWWWGALCWWCWTLMTCLFQLNKLLCPPSEFLLLPICGSTWCQQYYDFVCKHFWDREIYSSYLSFIHLMALFDLIFLIIWSNITIHKFLRGPLSFPGFWIRTSAPFPTSTYSCSLKHSFSTDWITSMALPEHIWPAQLLSYLVQVLNCCPISLCQFQLLSNWLVSQEVVYLLQKCQWFDDSCGKNMLKVFFHFAIDVLGIQQWFLYLDFEFNIS